MSNRRRAILTVYGIVFVNETIKAAFIPLAPGYATRLGLSHAQIGLVLAISSVATMVVSIPCGLLVDRLSARMVLLGALALLLLTAIAQGLANSFLALLIARAAFGVASAAIWVGAVTWLAVGASSDSGWGRVGGIVATSGVGSLIGPAIAGALARPALPGTAFLVLSAPVVAVAVAFARVPSPTRSQTHVVVRPPGATRGVWRRAITEPLILVAVLIQIIGGLTESVVNLLVPLALHSDGVSLAIIGLLFSAAAGIFLTVTSLCAAIASWLTSARAAALGMVLLACSLVPFLMPQSVPMLAVGVLLRMAFLGFLYTMGFPLASLGAERSGVGSGTTISIVNTAYGGAMALGPLAAGAASGALSEQWIYAVIVTLAVTAAAWMLRTAGRAVAPRVMADTT